MRCLIDNKFLAGWHWNLAFKNVFFEKGRTFVFYNPWFVVPYTRVYCTCSGILPVVCCTISTDSAQVKINFIQFLQYCMTACKGHTCMDP